VTVGYPGPPAGKIWIVTGFGYLPSVAETQIISMEKICGSGSGFALLNPVSLALYPAKATFVEQGMEYTLFPNEYITVRRGTHTAGSSMTGVMQMVEIDQPLYTYDEPQVVKRQQRAVSSIRTALGGAAGRGSGAGTAPTGGRPGGGGGALPV
jgi:hypothetical protein